MPRKPSRKKARAKKPHDDVVMFKSTEDGKWYTSIQCVGNREIIFAGQGKKYKTSAERTGRKFAARYGMGFKIIDA